MPDIQEFAPGQDFKFALSSRWILLMCRRKGPSPTPIQGFRLGQGQSVKDIEYNDFTSLGPKKVGTVSISPPNGEGVWLTRAEARAAEKRWGWQWGGKWDFWDAEGEGGCPWAGHGVYALDICQAVLTYLAGIRKMAMR